MVVTSVILVLFVFLCGVAGAMNLYFTDEDAGILGIDGFLMKESVSSSEATLTLNASENALWCSEQMGEDVTFSAGDWEVRYWASSTGGHRVYVRLYKFGEGSLTLLDEGYNVLSGSATKTKTSSMGPQSLAKNERICVEINWSNNARSDTLTLYFNSANHPSGLKTPEFQPLNQIPEFSPPTLVIAAALIIGGFAISRKN